MVYVVHYIPVINLFLTNIEFDHKVYWNIFLRAYLGRRANWRAVVGVRGAGRVEAQRGSSTDTCEPWATGKCQRTKRLLRKLGKNTAV